MDMEVKDAPAREGYAVVQDRGLPETAGYQPIVIGPGPGKPHPRPRDEVGPYTAALQIYSGNAGFNGTMQVDVQVFGITKDASGNVSLQDMIAQIPDKNPNGNDNRKQTITIHGQSKQPLPIYITPDGEATEALILARPQGGSGFGNCGAFWLQIDQN